MPYFHVISSFWLDVGVSSLADNCVLFSTAKIMASYANRSSKRDAKGKGKVGTSAPTPAPILASVPVLISSAKTAASPIPFAGTIAVVGGISSVGKSVPPTSRTKVAPVQPKRRRLTKQGIFRS
jgi:hypothetical protein